MRRINLSSQKCANAAQLFGGCFEEEEGMG